MTNGRSRWLTSAARSVVSTSPEATDDVRTVGRKRPALPSLRRRSGPRRGRAGSSESTRSRFERRAAAVRRRPIRLALALVLMAVLAGGFAWLVLASSVLAVSTVTVTGLADPAEERVAATAAAVPVGTPLARVDTAGAAERVAKIPTVASASVSRSWPSTVVVSVQRKLPVLAVKDPSGQLEVVDASGVPFEVVASLPPGVAEVNATSTAPDPEGIRAAISVLELLPPAQRATVSGVTVSTADLVSVQLGSVTVVWGGVADGPKKLAVLQALLATNPALIDVSAPDTPITR